VRPSAYRRPGDLQTDRLPTGTDRDPERQERAALALQVGEARELDGPGAVVRRLSS